MTAPTKAEREERIAQIRAREQAATPGPWTGDPEPYAIYIYGADGSPVADTHVPGKYGDGDAKPSFEDGARGGVDAVLRLRGVGASKRRPPGSLEANYAFMIHARDDVRWLLDHLDALEREVGALREFASGVRTAVNTYWSDGSDASDVISAHHVRIALGRLDAKRAGEG